MATRRQLGGSDLFFLPGKERVRLLRLAVAHGTRIRLRSILLTSGTTIVGLLPLLVQIERIPSKLPWIGVELPFKLQWLDTANQDIWQNLALTSIGGLLSSTVLILLVLPALYYASVRIGWAARQAGLWLASLLPTAAHRANSA
jgi:multidrug efflux pump subunit AcrB